jgi:hypothetical protein
MPTDSSALFRFGEPRPLKVLEMREAAKIALATGGAEPQESAAALQAAAAEFVRTHFKPLAPGNAVRYVHGGSMIRSRSSETFGSASRYALWRGWVTARKVFVRRYFFCFEELTWRTLFTRSSQV